jgi:recombination protein RecA
MPPKKKLAAVLSELRTKNKLKIGPLSEFQMIPEGLTTGNITLDALTGVGGLPQGRVIELFGPPSSGKTTTALQAAARLQKAGGNVVFADFERSLDEKYCQALGLDTEDESFIYFQPTSFEHGANIVRKLIDTGELGMAIHDSVARMVTEKEQEAETGKVSVADRAKMLHQYLRQIITPLHDTGCSAVFLNHLTELIDASPMGQKLSSQGIKRMTTPGGKALPFYASLRIEFKQVGNLRSKEMSALAGEKVDQIRQTKVQATVVKNKVGDPFGQAELRVRFGKGFSNEFSILDILRNYGVIKRDQQGKHTYPHPIEPPKVSIGPGMSGPDWIKGEDAVLKVMEEHKEWTAQMQVIALDLLAENGTQKVQLEDVDENGVPLDEAKALDLMESQELDEELGQ